MRFLWLLALILCSCATQIGAGGDAGLDGTRNVVPRDPETCHGVACASGELCCYTTATCFDPRNDPSACPSSNPPDSGFPSAPENPGGATPCASDADCAADEFCAGDGCLGPGFCRSKSNCGTCSGSGCEVCGCDGQTYPNPQTACQAGVRFIGNSACGQPGPVQMEDGGGPTMRARTPCATDSNCPQGQTCCALYSQCVDPTCVYCCAPPPAGTDYPCRDNLDCRSVEYCLADGCGTPGGCAPRATRGECEGTLSPVCGCDGRTYTNECWARAAGTRVASTGECRDAG